LREVELRLLEPRNRKWQGELQAVGNKIPAGRWPANVIHDGSDEVVALFPDKAGGGHWSKTKVTGYGEFGGGKSEYFGQGEKDGFGSAARFFYCAKASKRDRNEGLDGFEEKQTVGGGGLTADFREDGSLETASAGGKYGSIKAKQTNHHPTVKPTDLMRYLCRLITPPNGTVLDPFMGSGSTGKAAMYEGFKFIGVEMTDEYLPIAKARIEFAVSDNEGFLL
jgi:site-specific DNA-methyltransferase (adenine-specific)